MNQVYRYILENINTGKIDKNTAIDVITMLKKEEEKKSPAGDIAVIGMAVRMPQAQDTNGFWEHIINGSDLIKPFPSSRSEDITRYLEALDMPLEEIKYYDAAYLEEVDKFDYKFFRLTPKEASLLDPNQRLFLETVWEAFEDAGYGKDKLAGSRTGIFVGFSGNLRDSYGKMIYDIEPDSMQMSIPGNLASIITGRVSYLLDLKGPSMVIDTACSSSLVAIDSACQGIRAGHCEMAVAGGVKIHLVPLDKEEQKIGIESSTGRTKSFDGSSNGTGAGEGVAAVLLKPLAKALKDGDNIYAVIKGSAVNQDGASIGLTAPNSAAQTDVLLKAWENAGIEPETITYIEAHGTGTKLGDPIEIKGLTAAFERYTSKKQFCAISCVKTNAGHLYEAAGIAGFIKAVLALKHKFIPPMIHFNHPNNLISFEDSPVYINDKLKTWDTENIPRRCGVSSFGFSGTNCHIVLEEAPGIKEDESDKSDGPWVFTLSAIDEKAFERLLCRYGKFLAKNKNIKLRDLCYTSNTGRGHYAFRLAFAPKDLEDLREKIEISAQNISNQGQHKDVFISSHKVSQGLSNKIDNTEISEETKRQLTWEANEKLKALKESAGKHKDSLAEICRLYVSGADVDWELLYKDQKLKKVCLPVYPFERSRCWLEIPERVSTGNREIVQKNQKYEAQKALHEVKLTGREDGEYTNAEIELSNIWGEVLGYNEININDNFYELGGDSFIAMKVLNRINNCFDSDIGIVQLLSYGTIKELAALIDLRSNKKTGRVYPDIIPVKESEYYVLSSAQKRLFVLSQLEGASLSYNMTGVMLLEGRLDMTAFQKAFKELIARHEALRTTFEHKDGELVQRVHATAELEVLCKKADEDEVDSVLRDFIKPFDLEKAPLLRIGLLELGQDRHIVIFDIHHIISDGFTTGIIIKEFISLYSGNKLLPLKVQYKDFALWQDGLFKSGWMKDQEDYWLEVFSEGVPVLDMPCDFKRPSVRDFKGSNYSFKSGKELAQALKEFAARTETTLYMILLAAFNVLLCKYTGQEDIVVGSPIAGRPKAELEETVGMFVNTLALRNKPLRNKTFSEFLTDVKSKAIEAFDHPDYPFEELVEKLGIKRDMSRNPLFDVMFVLQNTQNPEIILKDLKVTPYPFSTGVSKFDLTLQAIEVENGIDFDFEYCISLFKEDTMKRMAGHFLNILNTIVKDPEIQISQIDILGAEEKRQIVFDFNETAYPYEKDKTIVDLFYDQVGKTPHKAAVTCCNKTLTYMELKDKADKVALMLKEAGVKEGTNVGIMIDRSCDFGAGVLGILSAVDDYLPMDNDYTYERLSYMLQDSQASFLLTTRKMQQKEVFDSKYIFFEDAEVYSSENIFTKNKSCTPGSLAYIIYTSGSTGRPKGVMVEHRGIASLKTFFEKGMGISENDRILQFASSSFDASVWEMFMALLNGASLYIASKEVIGDLNLFEGFMNTNEITVATLPPSYLSGIKPDNVRTLKTLITAGSATNFDLVGRWDKKLLYINAYGPTETTICATWWKATGKRESYCTVPIGTPIFNTRVFILNSDNQIQPLGIPGELCVGGAGLARGYINRPELTEEKFIDNPFEPGSKMYRTGDMARWLPDGNIEFLGRTDHQVKIRGYRIEPGEIENCILSHKDVEDVAVLDLDDANGEKYLCAYVVANNEIKISEIREHLSSRLPEYFVPSFFVVLDKLPLTPNGKVDRKALPGPNDQNLMLNEYEAPSNPLEEKLVCIWQQVLSVGRVGMGDDFFSLGGHSLKATQLVSVINREFDAEMPLKELFKSPTLRAVARYIENSGKKVFKLISRADKRDYYPLSSSQKRLFLINQMGDTGTGYNMPIVLLIEGKLQKQRLEKTLQLLINRHESLRTSFELLEDEPVQKIHTEVDFNVVYDNADESEILEKVQNFIRPFDLMTAPLIRAGLIDISHDRHILIFDMHHIISDGTSMGIIVREFIELYKGTELPELKINYKDFSLWQNEMRTSAELAKQEEYWMGIFKDEIPVLNMPTDFQRPLLQSFEGDTLSFELDSSMTKGLKNLAGDTGTTLYMVLLAAINVLLYKYTGQKDIIVGSPVAGRRHPDTQDTLGMFVNTLAMRNRFSDQWGFNELLEHVKENALNAYENQDYQFEELVEKLQLRRDLSRNPLFDIMFVMQNINIPDIILEGLKFSTYSYKNRSSKFDLTIEATEKDEGLSFNMEFCTGLFYGETILKMSQHLKNIINSLVEDPNTRIVDIDMMSQDEKKQIINDFNNTKTVYPRESTIHSLFRNQAANKALHSAVVCGNEVLNYKELDRRTDSLALILRKKGVSRNTIVALMVERSIEMAVGMLAILKAGGAYLPIDPSYPLERIEYMLNDSRAGILLANGPISEGLTFNGELIDLQDESCYKESGTGLDDINTPEDLAYIMYTSGSTGKPKGVMVEHRNVVRLVKDTNYIEFKEDDRILQTGAVVFDACTFEIWGALLNSLTLYLVDKDVILDAEKLEKAIKEYKITTLWLTSPLFNQLSQDRKDMFKGLRHLLVGGDVLSPGHIKNVMLACPQLNIINGYGPTENTTFSVCYPINRVYETSIPIGRPISNSTAYVVDSANKLQPVGIPGELYVGGDGVARGYLNSPELTEGKFVPDIFKGEGRMYRTGDLARWLPDGKIEFLGRIDNQVKVRGFRIELEEIENQLLKHEHIKEALVRVRTDDRGDKYLCAYVVTSIDVSLAALREYLKGKLPDYMIPSYFIKLESMPLNVNGKVDTALLPEPEPGFDPASEYVAPSNHFEEILSNVWMDVLGVDRVGINDNFFTLGGDSIKAIQIMARLKKQNLKTEIKALFQYPTIAELSRYVTRDERIIDQSTVIGEAPLTPIQKWFFDQDITEMHHYNQSVMLYKKDSFDEEALNRAFIAIWEHHDALRMVYKFKDDRIIQYNSEPEDVRPRLIVYNLENEKDIEARIICEADKLQAEFDLKSGPLLKPVLFKTKDGDHILIIIHHLVVDGVSWRILFEDLAMSYTQVIKGEEIKLQSKTHSYMEWSKRLHEYKENQKLIVQAPYWNELERKKQILLPVDNNATENRMKDMVTETIVLSETETSDLLKNVHQAYNTDVTDIMLAALGLCMEEWTGEDNLQVMMEGHGRENFLEGLDISRTIGWFTSLYPMVIDLKGDKDLSYYIKSTKETIRGVPDKGSGYGILKYLTAAESPVSIDFKLKPQISFNYLGQFDRDVDTGVFGISPYQPSRTISPNAKRLYTLEITSMVTQGRLNISFHYNMHEYRKETIVGLCESYKAGIIKIIEHCLGREETELTPSDLSVEGMDINEMEDVFDILDDRFN